MANEVKLPPLGENVAGGDVVEVKVAVGDDVQQGQALVEVEAEKSTVEVPSPLAGRVSQVLIKKGDKVKTGQTLVMIDGNGQAAPAQKEPAEKPAEARPAEAKTQEPKPAAEPAPAATSDPARPVPVLPAVSPQTLDEGDVVPAGPTTRRLAREWGIPLRQVPGSGPRGRVTQEDVRGYVHALATGAVAGGGPGIALPELPDFEQWGPVEYKPFDSIRKKTADQMALAWTHIPHVTHHDLADVSDIESFRKQQAEKGNKLTVTAFVLKACAIILKQMPQFNATLDLEGGRLVYKHYVHLGIAVDTERGLLVPVLRDVDRKSVWDIGKDMSEIAERARAKKITADDMKGGTFTISNLGGIGGTAFTPIVNWPQVAILGLSRSRMQPSWMNNQFVPRLMLPLSLSYDHRVIDGADAARFCRKVAELLENPMMMLLHA